MVHHRTFRATPVRAGTYAARSAAEARRKQRPEKRLRMWDTVAAIVPDREPVRIRLAPPSADPTLDVLKVALGRPGHQPWVEVGADQAPERSAAGYIARLRSHGIELDTARGRLVVKSRNALGAMDRALIEATEPLLIGELDGKRLLCAFCDLEAVTICYPHLPTCEEHAR